jgi:hypothetical protein
VPFSLPSATQEARASTLHCAFFFAENSTTGVICLDMLEAFCFPQLTETECRYHISADGTPPYFSSIGWEALMMTNFQVDWEKWTDPLAPS